MKFASALSVEADADHALAEALASVGSQLDGDDVDLALLFVTPHYQEQFAAIAERTRSAFGGAQLLGCTAHGVIGQGRETETGPALSLTVGSLPGATLEPFELDPLKVPGPDAGPGSWVEALGVTASGRRDLLILGDPSSNPEGILAGLDYAYQGTKVGGLASAPNGNTLFLNDRRLDSGLIGMALHGDVVVDPLVSQGCRPLGEPVVITRCRQNMLLELDGRRPTEILAGIYSGLDAHGRTLLERSLHLGVAASGLGEDPPEFLIRNVIGVDPLRGLLAVGAMLRQGQTVQFHVRDADAASEDLVKTFERYSVPTPPSAALLFACAGRGEGLFGRPNHDSEAFAEHVARVPIGGMFCAGEIGPVGSDTRLLGYTSSFGLIRQTATTDV